MTNWISEPSEALRVRRPSRPGPREFSPRVGPAQKSSSRSFYKVAELHHLTFWPTLVQSNIDKIKVISHFRKSEFYRKRLFLVRGSVGHHSGVSKRQKKQNFSWTVWEAHVEFFVLPNRVKRSLCLHWTLLPLQYIYRIKFNSIYNTLCSRNLLTDLFSFQRDKASCSRFSKPWNPRITY